MTVYGLSEGTTYNAQPFIYTEEGEIAGHIQQFQTIISNVSITWESPVSFQDDRPYVVVMEVGVKNHAYLGSLGIYYFSNITVQKHRFFGTQFSLQSNSHIHT